MLNNFEKYLIGFVQGVFCIYLALSVLKMYKALKRVLQKDTEMNKHQSLKQPCLLEAASKAYHIIHLNVYMQTTLLLVSQIEQSNCACTATFRQSGKVLCKQLCKAFLKEGRNVHTLQQMQNALIFLPISNKNLYSPSKPKTFLRLQRFIILLWQNKQFCLL